MFVFSFFFYQDETGFTGATCKTCPTNSYLYPSKKECLIGIVVGSDPLPDGAYAMSASDRVGTIGGVVDDFFQDYNNPYGDSVKPDGSMSKIEVIQKYGPIEK